MAGVMSDTMEKARQAVLGPRENDKLHDLAKVTKDISPDHRLTTDYGVKQTTHDDWLKVASSDKTGPLLLEDPLGREKVTSPLI